jgi:hypothetical protein
VPREAARRRYGTNERKRKQKTPPPTTIEIHFCRRKRRPAMANLCCICLESVVFSAGTTAGGTNVATATAAAAVGATDCGHCFHTECFALWQNSSAGRRGGGWDSSSSGRAGNVKCPTCNSLVKIFHPLYIDFGAVFQMEESGDDDDEDEESIEDLENDNDDDEDNEGPTETIIVIDDDIAVVERTMPSAAAAAAAVAPIPPPLEKQKKNIPMRAKQSVAKYKAHVKRQNQSIASLQKLVDELKDNKQDRQRQIVELERFGYLQTVFLKRRDETRTPSRLFQKTVFF